MDWERFYRNFRRPDYVEGYEILQKLGSGVFGEVYKARKRSIGKLYAIKFLRVEDPDLREAVLKELEGVKLLAQIDHPNLVSIEDQGQVDGIPYIVMSYAGDETLKDRLRRGPLPEGETLDLFRQVCAGVEALHARSVVHFDLKPANIYLKDGVARVGDYGLSKLLTQSRRTLSFGRGTPYYMAPEMLRRRGDHRADIYALGVILYECLTGRVPFEGETEWEVLRKHESEAVPFPPGLAPVYREILTRTLAKSPADRFPSVAAFRRALPAGPTGNTPPPPPPAPAGAGFRPLFLAVALPAALLRGLVRLVGQVLALPLRLLALALHLATAALVVVVFFLLLNFLFKLLAFPLRLL